jgi:hypothetical protein
MIAPTSSTVSSSKPTTTESKSPKVSTEVKPANVSYTSAEILVLCVAILSVISFIVSASRSIRVPLTEYNNRFGLSFVRSFISWLALEFADFSCSSFFSSF